MPVEPVGAVCGVQGVVGNAPCCKASVNAERIARVFHSTGRVHRLLGFGWAVARVADVVVLGA